MFEDTKTCLLIIVITLAGKGVLTKWYEQSEVGIPSGREIGLGRFGLEF